MVPPDSLATSAAPQTLARVAEWASILGLFASLIGFAITIVQVRRSKRAATQAAEAATKARDTLFRYDAAMDFASALATLDEIKRLHRAAAWQILPDRYALLRQKLIAVRNSGSPLDSDHEMGIQGTIQQLSAMEAVVESALEAGTLPESAAKFNEILSSHADRLTEALTSLRRRIEAQ